MDYIDLLGGSSDYDLTGASPVVQNLDNGNITDLHLHPHLHVHWHTEHLHGQPPYAFKQIFSLEHPIFLLLLGKLKCSFFLSVLVLFGLACCFLLCLFKKKQKWYSSLVWCEKSMEVFYSPIVLSVFTWTALVTGERRRKMVQSLWISSVLLIFFSVYL